MTEPGRERILLITGKLATAALVKQLPRLPTSYDYVVQTLPITVASLMTTSWIARHLKLSEPFDRIIVPGLCRGDVLEIQNFTGIRTDRGPADYRDLPSYLGNAGTTIELTEHSIEILAEINHAPEMSVEAILDLAERYRREGADIIDLGCTPGSTWNEIGLVVKELTERGFRVSVDSFDSYEVLEAVRHGAELVLSVNSHNWHLARQWQQVSSCLEVVVIPDEPQNLESLYRTLDHVSQAGIKYRLDPILEPIGLGLAPSLVRYYEVRQRYPEAMIMMGVGNLSELTDVDSVGINVLLAGLCQELSIQSILTTAVASWCRSCVREWHFARKLVHYAVHEQVPPKRLMNELILLRDPRCHRQNLQELQQFAAQLKDPNYRIFLGEDEQVHVINNSVYVRGSKPYQIMTELLQKDPALPSDHAYYLGFEINKAITALTLGKNYYQDQALHWGFLTTPEDSRDDTTQSLVP